MSHTIQDIIRNDSRRIEAALTLDSGTARIEVQMLLQNILAVARSYLLAHPEQMLDEKQAAAFDTLMQRRLAGEPLAYILGEREFYGLNFKVTPATLIPRPETELLVELALQHIPARGACRVLDLGTGSGAIALSIAHSRPDAEVTAVDASAEALEVSQENAQRLNLNNVRLLRSDWFSLLQGERFDLIVSNPPYVAEGDAHLEQGDLRFEPHSALASGVDGLDDIRIIIGKAGEHLKPGGHLMFEHGYDQAERVREILQQAGFKEVFSEHDLFGIERVSGGTWHSVSAVNVLWDTMQRPLRDLRISVTDRCNLRCAYCMPREIYDQHHVFLPRAELLSFEEIERLARSFIRLGVQKIRLTGGEPLLRKGVERLIEKLAMLRTWQGQPLELALTTNGVLLANKAQALKDAGLSRITVSLDSLDEEIFRRMSDSNVSVQTVLDGISAAQQAGFVSIKINMVVQKGVNAHEVLPMAEHFRDSGIVLRYIEYMDVGNSNGWKLDEVVSARQILGQISSKYPIEPVGPDYHGEVAERWRYADGAGEIGVIASITQAFCQGCTRARLSTDGKLYTCLFSSEGMDLRTPLRHGADDPGLTDLIAKQWQQRTDRYSELRHAATDTNRLKKIEMSYIGG